MDWIAAVLACVMLFVVYMLSASLDRQKRQERHLKQILRTRYTHPEELSEALSDIEDEFPELAPAGAMCVSDNRGDFILRRDYLREVPAREPGLDDKTVEACKRLFNGRMGFGYQPDPSYGTMPPPPKPRSPL